MSTNVKGHQLHGRLVFHFANGQTIEASLPGLCRWDDMDQAIGELAVRQKKADDRDQPYTNPAGDEFTISYRLYLADELVHSTREEEVR